MMSKRKHSHILFDAGGTLIGTNTDSAHWYEQFFVDACQEQGCDISINQAHESLKLASRSRKFESRCSSDEQVRQYWEHIYTETFRHLLGGAYPEMYRLATHYIDRYETGEYVRLFPDALPALQELDRLNYRLGIISNFATYLRSFLKQLEVDHYFNFVVISAEVGYEKPAKEIYQDALNRTGQPAEHVLYVGDHPRNDYQPAQDLGMTPLLIDRHNRYKTSDMNRIRSLEEIPAVIGTL